MDNTDYGSAMNEAALRDKTNSQEKRIQTLESQVRLLQITVDQLRGIQGSYGPIPHNYSILRTYDSGYHSQVVGQKLDPHTQSQDMQQPQGWYGYFGDAGGPLK